MSDRDTDILAKGSELFGYRVAGPIGRGGMGVVYDAVQLSLDRRVALKVLHPAKFRDPQIFQEFVREARTAAALNHPNLVAIHGIHHDSQRGLAAFAMEHIAGSTAQRLVRDQGTLPREAALHLTYQIASALGYAHQRGLVHRDVKPDNILVTADLTAKLLDLGLVHHRHDSPGGVGRNRLIIVGTPGYAAPEQLRDPGQAVPASDVWSLGATLCHLLTGRMPFDGTTFIDLVAAVVADPVELPASVPTDCGQLLEWMLEKDPEDRPANGDAVVAALDALAAGRPVRPTTRTRVPIRNRRPFRRR